VSSTAELDQLVDVSVRATRAVRAQLWVSQAMGDGQRWTVRASGPRVREQFGSALESDDEILDTAVLFSGSSRPSPGLLRVAEPQPGSGSPPREPGTEPGEP